MAPGFGQVEAFLGRVWGFSGQERGEKGNSLWVFLPAGKAAGGQREWIHPPAAPSCSRKEFLAFWGRKGKKSPQSEKRIKSTPF